MRNLLILLMMGSLFACSTDSSSQTNNSSEHKYMLFVPTQKYSEKTARILGRLYYLANPYEVMNDPMQITIFVQENAPYLSEKSEVIRCAQELGNLLINQGIQNFNPNNDREMMYKIGQDAGVDPLVTERAANEMTSGSTDMLLMGQELVWLSQVIPDAAEGNWNLFNTTGTDSRIWFYQMWPLIQSLTYEDEYTRHIFEQMMSQMQPIVEYQILILACMIQN